MTGKQRQHSTDETREASAPQANPPAPDWPVKTGRDVESELSDDQLKQVAGGQGWNKIKNNQ